MAKEAYIYGKRDLLRLRALYMHNIHTYTHIHRTDQSKRDLHIWQKRPTYMAKEAYIYGKRGLHIWQKRPTYMAKETY
jgi:hypothetical protein